MDPSQASINANQPKQTKTIICMDLKYYKAAAEGKIEVFKDVNDHPSLDLLLTPRKNTVLHIYITALNSGSNSATYFVKEILNMCPSLLWKANAKNETPLHIAARYGHGDIVEVLIEYCAQPLHQALHEDGIKQVKKMLRMRNKQGDTALHEVVRYDHPKVVELLIQKDPYYSYSNNNAYETPLYIAVERGFESVVFEILNKCQSPMHGGPLGRTALHAAVMRGNNHEGMTRIILDKIKGLSRKVDDNGWTPLHLAAYFNHSTSAELLLSEDREVAYMKDKKGRTALHIAAQRGSFSAMKSIVSRCPDCYELVDKRGWNVFHFAMKGNVASLVRNAIEIIIENPSLSNLLNEKNADGNTPLHFYSCSLQSAENFVSHPRVDKMAFNKENLNAYDIASTNTELPAEKSTEILSALNIGLPQRVITYEDEDEHKKKKDGRRSPMLQKAAEAHLVVAALITTVTFAACITMPGGFAGGGEGSQPGSALLRRNFAFKAFIIADTISMFLSCSAAFIHLLLPFLLDGDDDDDEEHHNDLLWEALVLIYWAIITMGIAFLMGTYAVLGPSWDLVIPIYIICVTFVGNLGRILSKFHQMWRWRSITRIPDFPALFSFLLARVHRLPENRRV